MALSRFIMLLSVSLAGVLLSGCDAPPGESLPVVAEPAVPEPTDQAAEERPAQDDDDKERELRRPLDLSMPPQPVFSEDASVDKQQPLAKPLLPDLFEQEETPDSRPIHLKGRVLMDESGQENLDTIEGGQIIIEMKNR